MNTISLVLPVTLLSLLSALPAQQKIHDLASLNGANQILGWNPESVANMGDLDGDGYDDIAAGSYYSTINPSSDGSVFVWSGRTQKLLATLHGSNYNGRFGTCVQNLGDVNKDGISDIGVGSTAAPRVGTYSGPGMVHVYSGKTQKLLYKLNAPTTKSYRFGTSMAPLGDIDADGYADFVVGAPGDTSQGRAYVYSGKRGYLKYGIRPSIQTSSFGSSIVALQDMDGDKIADMAIISYSARIGSTSIRGPILIHSGKTGREIRLIKPSPTVAATASLLLRRCEDVDGDKKPDLIMGFPNRYTGGLYYGEVQVYSSGTGKLLTSIRSKTGTRTRGFGECFDGIPDMDGDGSPEILVGHQGFVSGMASNGAALIYSAKTGKRLDVISSERQKMPYTMLGRRVGFLGDLNRDGNWDFWAYVNGSGAQPRALAVLSARPLDLSADSKTVSLYKGGKVVLSVHAGKDHAKDLILMIGSASGTTPGIKIGKETLQLNADSYLTFTLSAPHAVFYNNLSVLDANGEGKVGFTLPMGLPRSLAGTTLQHSCLFIGKGGLRFANLAVPLEIKLF